MDGALEKSLAFLFESSDDNISSSLRSLGPKIDEGSSSIDKAFDCSSIVLMETLLSSGVVCADSVVGKKAVAWIQRTEEVNKHKLETASLFMSNYTSLRVPVCAYAHGLVVREVSVEKGRGLFTTISIPAGEWVTNYGCDAFILKGCDEYIGGVDNDDNTHLKSIVKTHALDIDHPFVERIASGNIDDPLYLAHMANDGPGSAKFLDGIDCTKSMYTATLKYMQKVKSTCNAKMVRHRNGTATLRSVVAIPAGSEITWAYGIDYWACEKWFDQYSQEELQAKLLPSPNTPEHNVFKKCLLSFKLDTHIQPAHKCECDICV